MAGPNTFWAKEEQEADTFVMYMYLFCPVMFLFVASGVGVVFFTYCAGTPSCEWNNLKYSYKPQSINQSINQSNLFFLQKQGVSFYIFSIFPVFKLIKTWFLVNNITPY